MKFLCIGHATYDTTLPVTNYPIENFKYRLPEKIECGGGPASNAAYLLAKWQEEVAFIGIVGNDFYGQSIIKEFNNIGVNTDYIEKNSNIKTDCSYIISNSSNGSRTILISKSNEISALSEDIDVHDADVILVDGEHYETAKEVLFNNPNAISIIDAGRCTNEVINLAKLVNYVVCSKEFAEKFTNIKVDYNNLNSLVEIHKILSSNFNGNIIITLEKIGSFTIIDNQYKIVPSINVNTIDSTGAGDIFHGAFTYFIAMNNSLEKTIILSSITAALSTTKIGTRYSIPTLEEVLERYKKNEII